jgi:hypothetical protein
VARGGFLEPSRMVTPVAGKRGQNTGISGWADDDDVGDG